MRDYAEFRMRIERGTVEGTYRVDCSGLGGDGAGGFMLPFSATELENFVLKVGRTRRGVRKIESPEMQLARKFGGQLFGAIMQGKTGELYRTASSEARATGQGLRITLSLTDVPELGGIPWEYLYDDPNFLSINAWTPVVRYLDLPKPRRALEVELPLRILGVISNPLDSEPLDVEVEKAKLENALKPLTDANAVTIDWLEEPTLLALTKRLRPDTYHILHFIGHGGFDDTSGEGALLFEDAAGRGRAVSGDQLAACLYEKRSLRLVLLNSCEGARNSVQDPFSGVAASLVQREIPAVIGMQFEITDRAAVLFASEFYAMLAEGQPIDSAISEARLAIWADSNDVEWGTPVLFMRVADGRLFNVTHPATLPRPSPQDLPPKVEPTERDVAAAVAEPPVTEPPATEPPVAEPVPPLVGEPAPGITRSPPPADDAPPVVEPRPPVVERPPPPVVEPPPPVVEPPRPVVEPPRPVVEPPRPVVQQPTPVVEPQPPVTKPVPGPSPWAPPPPRPPRRIPWRWVIIGGIGTFFGLAVIGAFIPTEPEASGSLAAGSASPTASDAATPEASANGGASIAPAPVPPGILFYSDVEPGSTTAADKELYLIDPVTKVVSQLTHNDVHDTFATWSPDYTQIAFAREENRNRDIYIRDLDGEEGSERALVTGGTDDWFPAWSKDGLVAFARGGSSGPSSATLWVIPSEGGGQPREFLPGVHGRAPAWSTDGKTLAFMSDGNGNMLDVTVVRPGATEPEYLTAGPGDERNPTWSPNDQQIVFVSDADGDQEIYLLDIATNTVTAQLTQNNVLDGNPVWSPDGKEIAFFRATSAGGYHIWKINIETGKEDDLMPNAVGQNMDPNWR